MHNEFLVLDKDKMSKSAGGFITLQNLVEAGFDPLDYRYFLLGGHYRNQIKFSIDSLRGAQNARKSLLSALRSIEEKSGRAGGGVASLRLATGVSGPANAGLSRNSNPLLPGKRCRMSGAGWPSNHIEAFDAAIEDDLNTPRALSALWRLVKDGGVPPKAALEAAFEMDEVLGLDLEGSLHSVTPGGMDPAEIGALVTERAGAKAAKNFARADEIRGALKERGVILEDGPGGTVWRYG